MLKFFSNEDTQRFIDSVGYELNGTHLALDKR